MKYAGDNKQQILLAHPVSSYTMVGILIVQCMAIQETERFESPGPLGNGALVAAVCKVPSSSEMCMRISVRATLKRDNPCMQACAYGALDLVAKVGFGWAVMLSHPLISANQTEG